MGPDYPVNMGPNYPAEIQFLLLKRINLLNNARGTCDLATFLSSD